jgi:hypothetical protein
LRGVRETLLAGGVPPMLLEFESLLQLYIIFQFETQNRTAIYFCQQFAGQNSTTFSDSSFIYGSDLIAKGTRVLRQISFCRGSKG